MISHRLLIGCLDAEIHRTKVWDVRNHRMDAIMKVRHLTTKQLERCTGKT